MVCKQKTRVLKKAQVFLKNPTFHQKLRLYLIWKWTGLLKNPTFHQKLRLYLIWKWTGLLKNPTFHPKLRLYLIRKWTGLLKKTCLFIKNPGFNTKFLVFSLFFKGYKKGSIIPLFHQKKHDYKHVRRV